MVCSLSDAMGAKAARACDYCIRKRARWYCGADDAFLCQACDSSVHSANPLARRHGRVELNLSRSDKNFPNLKSIEPSWHPHPRKARTPRHGKPTTTVNRTVHLVPEICSEENSHNDEEQLLLYRVPIFDPNNIADAVGMSSINNMATEMELAEFAADVESLLGKGLDEESSFDMEGLGLGFLGDINNQQMECCFGFSHDEKVVKVEEENNNNAAHVLMNHTTNFDTLDLKFDYDDSPNNIEEEEEMSTVDGSKIIMRNKKTILLNLDYEGVILAWSDQRSPWTTGQRPELNSHHATWPDCMQPGCGIIHPYGLRSGQGAIAMADGGREARVSRYREKRRSRLFSKKIRYEVRKLNAEKRPRMKGRFVKRPNFSLINN